MKYLEEPSLDWANAAMSEVSVGDRVINGRIECFSCKKAGADKKLAKSLQLQYQAVGEASANPLGSLADANTRKLLINLISTMNASFPDYDFSDLKPEQFQKEVDLRMVVNGVNAQLAEIVEMDDMGFLEKLWDSIFGAISPRDCEIYSYIPDMDGCSDPFSDGTLWSFNYFFYHKTAKKILYFTCMSRSIISDTDMDDDEAMETADESENEDYDDGDEVMNEMDWEDGV
ncbi:hypothetical protein SDRG_02809 [Saprolegnia diclina VS20]|uniref:Repressor of RNA polymerase III transcription n=1 Tax=Saprolegnia diclina (strain VS20) TaxID=1156394 RepID=T0QPV7_SAPDV|nr:hypothetical protein SDRG_02809 [Saprolegnia diclina VS20]EQC40159.1 hypothetical protein SDRG_02809 [Saprolegnia diclina VS20]|eukprot:XP_008606633.1 hypothetical protein SDRG_02809 [Saprolegnia diclina VS20]